MAITAPFELLLSLDQRCRENSSGLPVNQSVVDDWIGIAFRINNVSLLAKMDDISEILPPPETIRVPGVKYWVKGLANIRGSLMPVLDLKAFLCGTETVIDKDSRILVINKMGLIAGLLVEEVYGLRRFKPDDHRDEIDPQAGSIREYLTGVFTAPTQQWNVFSVEKLVSTEQFIRVV